MSRHIALSVPAWEHSYPPVIEYRRIMFTKDFFVPFVPGCEMLQVTVEPQEVWVPVECCIQITAVTLVLVMEKIELKSY